MKNQRKTILLFFFASFYNSLFGQEFLEKTISHVELPIAYGQITPCDLDSDGDTDLIVSGTQGNNFGSGTGFKTTLGWLEKKNEEWQAHVLLDKVPEREVDYKVIDFDHDGDKDILYRNFNRSSHVIGINILRNNGSGGFEINTLFSAGDFARQFLAVQDLDQDNDYDILMSNGWYENMNEGGFTYHAIIHNDIFIYCKIVDIDQDMDLDLICNTNNSQELLLYSNDGNGNFTSHTLGNGFFNITQATTSDINNDGLTDLLISTQFPFSFRTRLEWFEAGSGGTYTRHTINSNLFSNNYNAAFHVLDNNSILAIENENRLYTLLSFDGNEWIQSPFITDDSRRQTKHGIYFADLDGDDKKDLIRLGDDAISWRKNEDDLFGPENYIYKTIEAPDNLKHFDYDNDGLTDIFSFDSKSGQMILLKNMDGVDYELIPLFKAEGFEYAHEYDFADLDQDGDLDFSISVDGFSRSAFYWYENRENEFESHYIGDTEGHYEVELIDIDHDEDMDIVACGVAGVTLYRNDGLLNYTAESIDFKESYQTYGIRVLDMDGDDDFDIIVHGASTLGWLEQNETGFTENSIVTGKTIQAMWHGDFDGDSDLDFVTYELTYDEFYESSDEKICLYKNEGQLNFERQVLINHIPLDFVFPSSFEVFDYENDGDQDIVIGGKGVFDRGTGVFGSNIFLFQNKGNETFNEHTIGKDWSISTRSISVFDSDDDGYCEIYAADAEHGKISAFIQNRYLEVPANLNFEETVLMETSSDILTISNPSATDITLLSISYPEGFSGDWENGIIASGNSQDILVTFSPKKLGGHSGVIEITSNSIEKQNTIRVSGTGVSILSVEGNEIDKILIYPNPSSNKFFVEFGASIPEQDVSTVIYSLKGKVIANQTTRIHNGKATIDTRELNEGVYILHLSGNTLDLKVKFIKVQSN